jgi:hypothetical protein
VPSGAGLLLLALLAVDAPPPLPEELPAQAGVKDGVFAVLLGLIETDSHGALTREHLERDLARRGATSRLPYRKLRELRRTPGESGGTALVDAVFAGPLEMGVPYTILGFHPGSLKAEEVCSFLEWRLGSLEVPSPRGPVSIQDVSAFTFRSGSIRLDFDAWLDWVMGHALDDTRVTGIAIYRHRGRWIGTALGWNDKGEPRSGSFDFQQDKVLIPPPDELKAATRYLRARLLTLGQTQGASAP